MNDENKWNREHHNESEQARSTHKKKKASVRKNVQKKTVEKQQVPTTDKLLQKIAHQNKTIIDLLKSIDSKIEKTPQPVQSQVKKEMEKVLNTPHVKPGVHPKKTAEIDTAKPRKQFVMRFDDKEPLNLDLEESSSDHQESVEEINKRLLQDEEVHYQPDEDENSVGEGNPFSFFEE